MHKIRNLITVHQKLPLGIKAKYQLMLPKSCRSLFYIGLIAHAIEEMEAGRLDSSAMIQKGHDTLNQ